jgi:hypothetical protein
MRFVKSRTTTVIAATLILIGGANIAAYAATGGSFLLGDSNAASRTTTLTNTGTTTVLSLKGSKSAPPLAVTSSKLVSNLNSDYVDGKHASAFQSKVGPLVWHPLALESGVTGNCDTGTPAYAVQFGIVYLQGDICGISAHLGDQDVFTLPSSIRPHRNYGGGDSTLYITVDECDGYTGRIDIDAATGVAYLQTAPGQSSTCFASLEGVSYPIG